jgi:hypothetical protein
VRAVARFDVILHTAQGWALRCEGGRQIRRHPSYRPTPAFAVCARSQDSTSISYRPKPGVAVWARSQDSMSPFIPPKTGSRGVSAVAGFNVTLHTAQSRQSRCERGRRIDPIGMRAVKPSRSFCARHPGLKPGATTVARVFARSGAANAWSGMPKAGGLPRCQLKQAAMTIASTMTAVACGGARVNAATSAPTPESQRPRPRPEARGTPIFPVQPAPACVIVNAGRGTLLLQLAAGESDHAPHQPKRPGGADSGAPNQRRS